MPESQTKKMELKEIVAQKWDLASENFDSHAGHGIQSEEEKEAWKRIFQKILPEKGLSILDVGCGTGELSIVLAEMGHKVTGIDLSQKMLEIARKKTETRGFAATFEEGDAEHPPFEDASFDVVLNRHLLWTLPNPEIAVKNWGKVLRKGGKVIIIDGIWDDGSLGPRLRRLAGDAVTLVLERKNPRKGHCGYSKELKAQLPNAGGAPPEKVKEYLETSGFRNIGMLDLKEVMDLQKKTMPLGAKIVFRYHYYLIYGNKQG